MLTISSLIWTVQPGLKGENPSAISLMVCEPADRGTAECLPLRRQQLWWLGCSWDGVRGPFSVSWAAMMANHHTRGLLCFSSPPPHPNTLQTAKPVTIRHQGSVVCQHLPADKDREGKFSALERASHRPPSVCFREKECVKRFRASTYFPFFFFPVTAAKQKTLMRGRKRHEYIRETRRLPANPIWWIVTMESSDK